MKGRYFEFELSDFVNSNAAGKKDSMTFYPSNK